MVHKHTGVSSIHTQRSAPSRTHSHPPLQFTFQVKATYPTLLNSGVIVCFLQLVSDLHSPCPYVQPDFQIHHTFFLGFLRLHFAQSLPKIGQKQRKQRKANLENNNYYGCGNELQRGDTTCQNPTASKRGPEIQSQVCLTLEPMHLTTRSYIVAPDSLCSSPSLHSAS